uniref:formyltransferase family protein n=1 Tax=Streptomyces clavuligerus TaxID=1901 RepID=UPI0022B09846
SSQRNLGRQQSQENYLSSLNAVAVPGQAPDDLHEQHALAYGVRVTGCTVHFVDEGVDTGPVIAQRAVEVRDEDDEAALHERIKEVERVLLVEVVGRLARHGHRIEGRKVVFL